MRIEKYVPYTGSGVSTWDVFSRVRESRPHDEMEVSDVDEALRIAAGDGKVKRIGCYWWRNLDF